MSRLCLILKVGPHLLQQFADPRLLGGLAQQSPPQLDCLGLLTPLAMSDLVPGVLNDDVNISDRLRVTSGKGFEIEEIEGLFILYIHL